MCVVRARLVRCVTLTVSSVRVGVRVRVCARHCTLTARDREHDPTCVWRGRSRIVVQVGGESTAHNYSHSLPTILTAYRNAV